MNPQKQMLEVERTDLINSLVSFGLTPVQAQTYLTLLKLGSTTAKSISRSSDINRVDIYRALRNLKKYGIVEEKLGNPAEFVAVAPDQALDTLISARVRAVDNLRETKPDLKHNLEEYYRESRYIQTDSEEDDSELFLKVVYGEQMFRRVQTVALVSKREMVTVFAPPVMVIYDEMGIPDVEARRSRENLRIRAITNIIPENLDQCAAYARAVELRHNDLPPSQLRYTISDDEKLILAVGEAPSDITEGTALWTNSKVMIKALRADFESLWQQSVPAKERISILLSARIGRE